MPTETPDSHAGAFRHASVPATAPASLPSELQDLIEYLADCRARADNRPEESLCVGIVDFANHGRKFAFAFEFSGGGSAEDASNFLAVQLKNALRELTNKESAK